MPTAASRGVAAADGEREVSIEKQPSGTTKTLWTCTKCTFQNPSVFLVCGVCSARRPQKVAWDGEAAAAQRLAVEEPETLEQDNTREPIHYIKKELYDSELIYARGLNFLCKEYLGVLQPMLSSAVGDSSFQAELSSFAATALTILNVNENMLKAMQEAVAATCQAQLGFMAIRDVPQLNFATVNVSDVLVQFMPMMRFYIPYVTACEMVITRVHSLSVESAALRKFLSDTETELRNHSGFEYADTSFFGLAITPIQRLGRYRLFVDELIKHTRPRERRVLRKVLRHCKDALRQCNERKEEFDNASRVQQLQARFKHCKIPEYTLSVVREGDLIKMRSVTEKGSPLYLYILNHGLYVVKKKKPTLGSREKFLPFSHMSSTVRTHGRMFCVVVAKQEFRFLCPTDEECASWVESVAQALDQFLHPADQQRFDDHDEDDDDDDTEDEEEEREHLDQLPPPCGVDETSPTDSSRVAGVVEAVSYDSRGDHPAEGLVGESNPLDFGNSPPMFGSSGRSEGVNDMNEPHFGASCGSTGYQPLTNHSIASARSMESCASAHSPRIFGTPNSTSNRAGSITTGLVSPAVAESLAEAISLASPGSTGASTEVSNVVGSVLMDCLEEVLSRKEDRKRRSKSRGPRPSDPSVVTLSSSFASMSHVAGASEAFDSTVSAGSTRSILPTLALDNLVKNCVGGGFATTRARPMAAELMTVAHSPTNRGHHTSRELRNVNILHEDESEWVAGMHSNNSSNVNSFQFSPSLSASATPMSMASTFIAIPEAPFVGLLAEVARTTTVGGKEKSFVTRPTLSDASQPLLSKLPALVLLAEASQHNFSLTITSPLRQSRPMPSLHTRPRSGSLPMNLSLHVDPVVRGRSSRHEISFGAIVDGEADATEEEDCSDDVFEFERELSCSTSPGLVIDEKHVAPHRGGDDNDDAADSMVLEPQEVVQRESARNDAVLYEGSLAESPR